MPMGIDIGLSITRGEGGGSPPYVIAPIGDSRVAQIHADAGGGTYRNRTAFNHFNWGNALSGQRAKLAGNWGFSGDRTDQSLARLSAALASGAGTLYIHEGVNDLAQSYTAAQILPNITAKADAALARGWRVIIVLEPGSTSFASSVITELKALNAALVSYASGNPRVTLFDLPSIAWANPNPTTSITFVAGYSTDGTHQANYGAYLAGKSFSTLLSTLYSATLSRTEGIQLLTNGDFSGGTSGTKNTGITGSIATSWTGTRTGSATAVGSVAGSEQVLTCTFTAAGEEIRLYQDINNSNWNIGDTWQAWANIAVDSGSSGFAGPYLYLQNNGSPQGGVTAMDLFENTYTTLTTEAYEVWPRTERLPGPAYSTKSWLTVYVRLFASGAGSAVLRVRDMHLRRMN